MTAAVAGLVMVLLAASAAAAALHASRRGEILPGVTVAGVSVGGLGPDDARAALSEAVGARRSQPVHLRVGDERFTVRPDQAGLSVDLEATLHEAQRAGRDGGLLASAWHHLDAGWHEIDTDLVTDLDRKRLAGRIAGIAEKVDRSPSSGAIEVDPDSLEVTTIPPREGLEVRRRQAADAVALALRQPGAETVALPTATTPTAITKADVEAVADRARAAMAAPLTLTGAGTEVVLQPEEIAPLLALRRRGEGQRAIVELHVPEQAVEESLGGALEPFNQEPTEPSFDVGRTPPVTLEDQDATTWQPVPAEVATTPGQTGTRLRPAAAARQLTDAVQQAEHRAELDVETLQPEISASETEITHLLGTFTTHHECCQARVTNIHRLADMVDGALVAPGEQFSVNQISGVRSCDKGFEPAGTIIDGELVDTCGGGVSQFGTTTFNAAFFAGVPIDTHKAHSRYISRYPLGREATLNYPSPDIDVRFTNDTGTAMLVKTAYTDTSITVSIYGSSDVREVRATLGERFDFTESSTEVRTNEELPEGSSQVVQSGVGGFSVEVRRIITRASGEQDSRTFTTVYEPVTEIIERNPG